MKNNQISIIILLFKTPPEIIKNLKNYRDFNLLILDQSNNQANILEDDLTIIGLGK